MKIEKVLGQFEQEFLENFKCPKCDDILKYHRSTNGTHSEAWRCRIDLDNLVFLAGFAYATGVKNA